MNGTTCVEKIATVRKLCLVTGSHDTHLLPYGAQRVLSSMQRGRKKLVFSHTDKHNRGRERDELQHSQCRQTSCLYNRHLRGVGDYPGES